MTTLTVTAKGQVTLRKDVLRHLGVSPGQQIEVVLLPEGRVEVRARRPSAPIERFIGILAGKSRRKASIEELKSAAARGWAGRR